MIKSSELDSSVHNDSGFGNALLYCSELVYMYFTKAHIQGPNPTGGLIYPLISEVFRGGDEAILGMRKKRSKKI